MLPSEAPKLSGGDFDPATMADEDVDMDPEEDEGGSGVKLSSVEINILVYLYLLESNFPHTAFTLLSESSLPSTSLFQHFHPSFPTSSSVSRGKSNGPSSKNANGDASPDTPVFGRVDGRIPRGELVRKLWKGLRWEEVERHVNKHGEPFKPQCPSPFHLLIPHVCPSSYPSSSQNPPLPLPSAMRISPPPRRSEVFPPPAEVEAGPSRPRSSAAERLGANGAIAGAGKAKRRSRRNSTESENRQASPTRSSAAGTAGGKDRDAGGKKDKSDREREREKAEKKRSRASGDGLGDKDGKEKRDRPKGKEAEDRETNGGIPKIRIRHGDKGKEGADSRDPSPGPIEKKRKRDKDKERDELRPPSSGTGVTSERRSKSPIPPLAGPTGTASTPVSRKSRASSSDSSKPKRGAGNPLWIPDEAVSTFKDHRDSVVCLGWNPRNPSLLATGSIDGYARLWEFDPSTSSSSAPAGTALTPLSVSSNGQASIPVKHTSVESSLKKLSALSWHPEGSVVATAAADGVGRLFTPNGQLQGIMSYGRRPMAAIKFSPDGRQVLTAKHDFTVNLWTVEKGYSQVLAGSYDAHTKEVNDVDWLDNNVFATGGNDHTIFIFRTSDKDIRYTLKGHTDDVTRIQWSPAPAASSSTADPSSAMESRLLASVSDDGYAMVWKLPAYPMDKARFNSRSASPTKQPSASASASTPGAHAQSGTGVKEDEDYFEGQGRKGKEGIEYCVARFCVVDAENKRLNTLEWSPACRDGRMLLAAGAQDSTVKIFDVTSGQLLHHLKGLETGTASLSFSPLGIPGYPAGAIAAGGWMGQVRVWDVETGEKRAEWEVENTEKKSNLGILAMSWRDDGKQLALAMQNKLVITIATDLEGMIKRIKGKKVEKVERA